MSTKPTILPEWNTGGTNRTAPSPTRKLLGFLLGERPPSGYFNELFFRTYKWLEYLKDGAFSGNHSITGDLNVTGALTGTGILKHGDQIKTLNAFALERDGGWTIATNGLQSVADDVAYGSIPFDVGDRVKSLKIALKGNAATDGDITVTVSKVATDGTVTSIGSGSSNNQANAWADLTVDLTDTTITDSLAIIIGVASSIEGGITVGSMRFTYDRP